MITMVIGSAVFMSVHHKGTFEIDRDKKIPEEKARQANRDSAGLFVAKIAALVVTCASTAVFFTTEEMDNKAPIYNGVTYIHCILFVIFIAIYIYGRKEANSVNKILKEKKKEEDGFYLD